MQSDDGSTKCIIVIGGLTGHYPSYSCSKTTEILDLENREWVQGPELPIGLDNAACVALPPASNFACVVLGGRTDDKDHYEVSNVVYGLNKKLTEWTFLGKMREGTCNNIALLLS